MTGVGGVVWLGCLLGVAFAGGARAEESQSKLESLAWLAGSWGSDSAGTRIEEHWMAPRGGLMVAMHRDVIRGRARMFEFLRIVEDTSGVAYVAQPLGRPPVRFPLVESGPQRVVFANPGHDFPKRILYWREGDVLRARTEGDVKGQAKSEEWSWRSLALDR